ncbi:hypothetical protein N7493_010436 [Penicillium malachiteum]|uniref:Uncharacterized protein n=1 Tax=Penicillium malachiteum TaxID=1324776 RepID=A0AAD6MRH2_9EURO|nr:hypothetical protein N7493_010436 [Penicillium malachiteum]
MSTPQPTSRPAPQTQRASSPKKRALPQLKQHLQEVADARGKAYVQQSALLVYWQTDNTNAKDDVTTMECLFKNQLGVDTTTLEVK